MGEEEALQAEKSRYQGGRAWWVSRKAGGSVARKPCGKQEDWRSDWWVLWPLEGVLILN